MANTLEIRTANEVYDFVRRLKAACVAEGAPDLCKKLDDSMRLGSSGLEILGAIRGTIIANRQKIDEILGPSAGEEIGRILGFINRAFVS
jgi:hypothetical protein